MMLRRWEEETWKGVLKWIILDIVDSMQNEYSDLVPLALKSRINDVLKMFDKPQNKFKGPDDIDFQRFYVFLSKGIQSNRCGYYKWMDSQVEKNKTVERNNIFMCKGVGCNSMFGKKELLQSQKYHQCDVRGLQLHEVSSSLKNKI